MRAGVAAAILLLAALGAPSAAAAECAPDGAGGSHCLYRSLLPSAGIVARCRDDRDCRVGYYYGNPDAAVWIAPPADVPALPKPEVSWLTATLAHVRFDCGPACSLSYFFEAKRHRLSEPQRAVLAVDPRRLLVAAADGRALAVRQMFSGRPVARIERDWAPAPWLGEVITALSFDPDGRLSLTWRRGAGRESVSERISISAVAR